MYRNRCYYNLPSIKDILNMARRLYTYDDLWEMYHSEDWYVGDRVEINYGKGPEKGRITRKTERTVFVLRDGYKRALEVTNCYPTRITEDYDAK